VRVGFLIGEFRSACVGSAELQGLPFCPRDESSGGVRRRLMDNENWLPAEIVVDDAPLAKN
jgi:hypothetical protein